LRAAKIVKTKASKRNILVILSNRLNRLQKPRFFALEADDKGNILHQRPLRAQPKEARFDEVWENEEGRTDIASTHRFKRKYRHPLEKPKGG
jgi:hypothetical protein